MKKILIMLSLIFMILLSGSIINANNNTASNPECKSLYWFDNEHQECGYKEFCGMYMYLGLQTFESKTQCEKALNESKK